MISLKELSCQFETRLDSHYTKKEIDYLKFLLFEHFLAVGKIDFFTNREILIDDSKTTEFLKATEELLNDKPIQYIIGECEFDKIKLKLNNNVLIPRPETEEMISLINGMQIKFDKIIDIGTGSGCIAISLKKRFPYSDVTATDFSTPAISLAKENAILNKVDIDFILHDILDGSDFLKDNFDLIVSNPPYVKEEEKQTMKRNVLDYEPHNAIFVKNDKPLVFYKAIASFAGKSLNTGGIIVLEINENLAQETKKVFDEYGFKNAEIIKDLFKKDRFLIVSND